MSIAFVNHKGDMACRLFMRSHKLGATRAVTGLFDAPVRIDILTRAPLDALATLGLRDEADALRRAAKDWRWLTKSELAAAIDADATILEEF